MRTVVTGWFSFPDGEGTVGDLRAAEVVCRWLDDAGIDYDVAGAGSFTKDVDWRAVAPTDYSQLVFVCGPAHGADLDALLDRFAACHRVGIDVSVVPGMHWRCVTRTGPWTACWRGNPSPRWSWTPVWIPWRRAHAHVHRSRRPSAAWTPWSPPASTAWSRR